MSMLMLANSSSASCDEGEITDDEQSERLTQSSRDRGDDLSIKNSEVNVSVSRTDSGMALGEASTSELIPTSYMSPPCRTLPIIQRKIK